MINGRIPNLENCLKITSGLLMKQSQISRQSHRQTNQDEQRHQNVRQSQNNLLKTERKIKLSGFTRTKSTKRPARSQKQIEKVLRLNPHVFISLHSYSHPLQSSICRLRQLIMNNSLLYYRRTISNRHNFQLLLHLLQ